MKNSKNLNFIVSFLCVLSLYIYRLPFKMNSNNTTYALEHINMYDETYFANNIALSCGFSPRFFLNFLVSTLMKINGGNWESVALILIYFAAIILAFATVKMVFNITDKNQFLYSMILSFCLAFNVNNYFPGWGSFELQSLGLGQGYAFVMLALAYVIGKKKNYNLALILLAVATLFHIHEGIWGFFLIFIFFIYDLLVVKVPLQKSYLISLAIFSLVLLISAFPAFSGIFTGEKSKITPEVFKLIYIKRVSHHVFPEGWSASYILKYFLVIFCGAILRIQTLYYADKSKVKNFLVESSLFVFSWVFILFIAYFFTSIIVVPSIVTMYVTKYLKYVAIISCLWSIKNLINLTQCKEKVLGLSLIMSVYTFSFLQAPQTILMYLILYFFINLYKSYKVTYVKALLIILPFVAFFYINSHLYFFIFKIFCILILVVLIDGSKKINSLMFKWQALSMLSLVLLFYVSYGKIWNMNSHKLQFVDSKDYIINSVGKNFYRLAKRFSRKTSKTDIFLANPFDGGLGDTTAWFQLTSRRNTFGVFKILPSDLDNLTKWHKRIERAKKFFNVDLNVEVKPKKIIRFLRRNKIGYILVKNDYFDKFDSKEFLEVFARNDDDSYRVYKVK